jgi:hypothetical protein
MQTLNSRFPDNLVKCREATMNRFLQENGKSA